MKKAEKLRLGIDAIDQRLEDLKRASLGGLCPLCIRLNGKCHRCPARRNEIYACFEYIEDIESIKDKLRQQKCVWKSQLEKLEGKKQ